MSAAQHRASETGQNLTAVLAQRPAAKGKSKQETSWPMAKTGQNPEFLGARVSVGKHVHLSALTWDIPSALN